MIRGEMALATLVASLTAVQAFQSPNLRFLTLPAALASLNRPRFHRNSVVTPAHVRNMRATAPLHNPQERDYTATILALQAVQKARQEVQQAEEIRKQAQQEAEKAVERLKASEAAARAELMLAADILQGFATVRRGPEDNICAGKLLGADLLKQPQGVAIDSEGHILVSDGRLHQIIVFNRDGSVARRLGSIGTSKGEFLGPHGLAMDRQGHIVVADRYNNRIQVLHTDGSLVNCFGSNGTAAGLFEQPKGVAIGHDGHIIVADSMNHRIQVFTSEGDFVRQFGSYGSGLGQLILPSDVAVDNMGRIVVADDLNHRVQVFNGDGSVAMCFGSFGRLTLPRGVAIDREGRFLVSDWHGRIQVFNSDGSRAHAIGAGEGGGVGQLKHPLHLAVDEIGGNIVVCDQGNHRVQVF